nr:hypothetical protein [Rhodoferax sp.]
MDHFLPEDETIAWSSFETTKQHLEPAEVVQVLAGLCKSLPSLTRLERLCLSSSDIRFLGALLYLISTPESQDILMEWGAENRHACGLARLGRTLWGEQEAIVSLRPFREAQLVKLEFFGKVDAQYLAAMAAARRALPSGNTSTWLQRLRIYIVLRAMDALESNIPREKHLFDVCRTIRQVCEFTDHKDWELVEAVAGSATGYQGFVAETTIRCCEWLSRSALFWLLSAVLIPLDQPIT